VIGKVGLVYTKLPKLLARNSLYDFSIGEERVGMVASQNLVLRKS
jgi:hypothetical protein